MAKNAHVNGRVTRFKIRKWINEYFDTIQDSREVPAKDISAWIKNKYGVCISSVRIARTMEIMGFKCRKGYIRYGKRKSKVYLWRRIG